MKNEIISIKLSKSVVKTLKRIRKYPRETYNEIIIGLIKNSEETNPLNKFVQGPQKAKMKELWTNGDYEGWESA